MSRKRWDADPGETAKKTTTVAGAAFQNVKVALKKKTTTHTTAGTYGNFLASERWRDDRVGYWVERHGVISNMTSNTSLSASQTHALRVKGHRYT